MRQAARIVWLGASAVVALFLAVRASPAQSPAPPVPPLPPPLPSASAAAVDGGLFASPLGETPGFFAAAEVGLVFPHVRNRLVSDVFHPTLGPRSVRVPAVELDTTVAPRVELGYRLPEGLGAFLLSYRFFASDGSLRFPSDDSPEGGRITSRLDVNILDLDYASQEHSPAPAWDMKWTVGVRLANLFLDSRAEARLLSQRVSNRFLGAGPHVGLDLWRNLPIPGLSLQFRGEGALAVGNARQGFEEVFTLADGSRLGAASTVDRTNAVPSLHFQVGLAWTPPGWMGTRLSAGYLYEHWWFVGNAGASRADVRNQGLFLRAEYEF